MPCPCSCGTYVLLVLDSDLLLDNSVDQALLVSGSYTVRGNSASEQFDIGETLLLKIDGGWYFSPDIGQSWRE